MSQTCYVAIAVDVTGGEFVSRSYRYARNIWKLAARLASAGFVVTVVKVA
jgi:hypothetical protein